MNYGKKWLDLGKPPRGCLPHAVVSCSQKRQTRELQGKNMVVKGVQMHMNEPVKVLAEELLFLKFKILHLTCSIF